MAIRYTQQPVEVLELPTPIGSVRVTQAPVEILEAPTTAKVRLTQVAIEVLWGERHGFPWAGLGPWITAPVKRITG